MFAGGRQFGSVTSGGYGYPTRGNLALAYVDPDLVTVGSQIEISILGERFAARVVEPVRYDCGHGLMRG